MLFSMSVHPILSAHRIICYCEVCTETISTSSLDPYSSVVERGLYGAIVLETILCQGQVSVGYITVLGEMVTKPHMKQ